MENIILIGMPTAGKSTIGVILAKVLGYDFIDTDLLIQAREKKLLKEIIESKGLRGFVTIENEVNAHIIANRSVIATGGSVIYGEEAMEHLREIGKVVYIKLSYSAIKRRLLDAKQRGVVLKDNQTLYELYKERCPLYEKYAHVIIKGNNKNIETLVQEIIDKTIN